MTNLNTWTKTKLRNVPHCAADIGLNFTTAVIATIDGPGNHRRGRSYFERQTTGLRRSAIALTPALTAGGEADHRTEGRSHACRFELSG